MSAGHHHENTQGHGHSHGHHHHHHAPEPGGGGDFALAIGINLVFVVAESLAGLFSGSIALVADAGHNLSDVLSLVLAWVASTLSRRAPSDRFTYGLKSSSILAAIANAALLWVAVGGILVETIRRLADPAPTAGMTMIWVAAAGIVVNGASALLFAKGSKSDLNLRGAFVHLMADAAVSAGVVIAGLLILATGLAWIDPIASLLVTAVIGWSSWGLMRDSLRLGLLGVPASIDLREVRGFLAGLPGVTRVHDLHVWPMSTTESALTAHLVIPEGQPGDAFLHQVAHDLEHRFGIGHPTLQIEMGDGDCALQSEAVI
ncbi:cation diffusion facilitator family transporter [Novosphingobium sp. 9U]|uniref:cation diffusion facilitator family transporter n=1 Tax=Novosphingobium sp. 9U TaxID=2653158 RepID=UPI0012F446BA|nr:cation diffusion facilitator family transporter [Novosphingobium sp. 9U]VWX47061.1 Cobalt-zinc-cadmium resistance protein CzcD [Novosphingobium sp. 9U]